MAMSRKHFVAVAKTIRDSTAVAEDERINLAVEMADALEDPDLGVRNFDRETFIAFATSATR